MVKWLVSLVASSFTFALADVLCDVCIAEKGEDEEHAPTVETAAEDDDGEEGIEMHSSDDRGNNNSDSVPSLRALALQDGSEPAYKQVGDDGSEPWELGLTGAQDAAIAGAH